MSEGAYERRGLYPRGLMSEGAYNRNKMKRFETSYSCTC